MNYRCLLIIIALLAIITHSAIAAGWEDDFNSYKISQPLPSPWTTPEGQTLKVVSDRAGGQCLTDGGTQTTAKRLWGNSGISVLTTKFKLPLMNTSGALDIGISSSDGNHFVEFQALNNSTAGFTMLYMYYVHGGREQKSAEILANTWYDIKLVRNDKDWTASYKQSSSKDWIVLGSTSETSFMRDVSIDIDSVFIKFYPGFDASPSGSTFVDNVTVN